MTYVLNDKYTEDTLMEVNIFCILMSRYPFLGQTTIAMVIIIRAVRVMNQLLVEI